MKLVPWSPFPEMDEVFKSYNRALAQLNDQKLLRADWAPAVDITENNNAFVIRVELAGMKRDDVNVQIHNGVLTVSGERKSEVKDEKEHRIERFYGKFSRSFSLPEQVNESGINAEFKDGVLSLNLPKSEKQKPQAIQIEVR